MNKNKIILFAIDASGNMPDSKLNQIKQDIYRKLGYIRYFYDDDISAFIVCTDTAPHNLQYIATHSTVENYNLCGMGGTYISNAIKQLTDGGFPEINELYVYSDMYLSNSDLLELEENNPNTKVVLIDIDHRKDKMIDIPDSMTLDTNSIKKVYIRGDEEKDSCSLMEIQSELIGKTIKSVQAIDSGLRFELDDGATLDVSYDTSEMGNIFFDLVPN